MFSALAVPLLVLVLAVIVPLATARLLAAIFLRDAPPSGEERARRLAPFRSAATLVETAQILLAATAGSRALAPPLVSHREAPAALLFGLLPAAVAFLAGGVARRIEEPADDRSTVRGAALLRLRVFPWFLGPGLAGQAACALPVVDGSGAAATIRWGMLLLSLVVIAVGVAYGGLLAMLATGAIRVAPPAVRDLAREVAARERTPLALVLRLPTPGARFANAAAIPWARTMVVTDCITGLLSREELSAVLAHEAGHLSEPSWVVAARLFGAVIVFFGVTVGTRVAEAMGASALIAPAVAVGLGLPVIVGVRRLARHMEERADARARDTVGGLPMASALCKLHAHAQLPMVTGARRVHPDLYDRLAALGVDPGPRPPPPRIRRGLAAGLCLGSALFFAGLQAVDAALPTSSDLVNRGVAHALAGRQAEAVADYRAAMALDPDDATTHYDLAIALQVLGDRRGALEEARTAVRLGETVRALELLAGMVAAEGQGEEAQRLLQRAETLRQRER